MKPACEVMVKNVLPIFRALVAEDLISNYGLTQTQAASKLGITQAAISQYLREKRAHTPVSMSFVTDVQSVASEFAERMASTNENVDMSITSSLCKLCPILVREITTKATAQELI